jgi:ABC-type sugar transport system ATPase subunit
MDEPTAPLTTARSGFLYEVVRRLKARGVTIIYISHRLKEIFDLCDRVSVLRDGELVATLDTAATTEAELVALDGRPCRDRDQPASTARAGEVMLEARGAAVGQGARRLAQRPRRARSWASPGLVGAGRTETARLIFGADPREGGEVLVDGAHVRIRSPGDAIAAGIG